MRMCVCRGGSIGRCAFHRDAGRAPGASFVVSAGDRQQLRRGVDDLGPAARAPIGANRRPNWRRKRRACSEVQDSRSRNLLWLLILPFIGLQAARGQIREGTIMTKGEKMVALTGAVRARVQPAEGARRRTARRFGGHDGDARGDGDAVAGGAMTVPQIAKLKGVTRQHIQLLADALVAAGLAAVKENPAHRRSSLIALTEKGKRVFAKMRAREAPVSRKSRGVRRAGVGARDGRADAARGAPRRARARREPGANESAQSHRLAVPPPARVVGARRRV